MVYNVVVSSEFFPQLKKAIALLGVLPAAQKMFERSSTPILDVCRMVLELPQKYSEMNMPMSEFGIIISILDDQSNLVYGDAYGVSFLLDPQYGGEVMDEEVRESVVDFVYNWNGPDHENAATVELMRIRCFSRRHSRAQIGKEQAQQCARVLGWFTRVPQLQK
ncbi:hypothetical protein F441_01347 [Phytophthora nicotianae CJ01A1]|uniref:Uncharacterized protein n=1 Tax=Phytophthora nicotianae CJ01A1 TaxID=1317063 RepID=W2XSI3_PHYNI|nr:hypothetical protein F441_01347 [Phytophthora nicotianae CJ01A1]